MATFSFRRRSATMWTIVLVAVSAALAVPSTSAAQQNDPQARRASTTTPDSSAPARAAIPQAMVGTLDISKIFDDKTGYARLREETESFKKAVEIQQAELAKGVADAQAVYSEMERLQPNSPEHKKQQARLTEIQAQLQAKKQTAEREFDVKYAETLLAVYADVQKMTARVAQHKGLTLVIQASAAPPSEADPMTAANVLLSQPVIYSDSRTDITSDVLTNLNHWYNQSKTTTAPAIPAPAANAPATAAPKSNDQ